MSKNRHLNPEEPVEVTPRQYERQVLDWIVESENGIEGFEVEQREKIDGAGGEYEIDVVVDFMVFGGAQIRVLVECKRWSRRVNRDQLLAFNSKIEDTGSHKGIVFSTGGFQKGAIDYAAQKGIATVVFESGDSHYETKGVGPGPHKPPPWIDFPDYAGSLLTVRNAKLHGCLIDESHLEALANWLDLNGG